MLTQAFCAVLLVIALGFHLAEVGMGDEDAHGVVVAVAFSQTLEAQVGSPAGPVPVEILTARRQAVMTAS